MAGFREFDRLKYFSTSLNTEGTLQILMVSTNDSYLNLLANNLYIAREVQNDKRNYNLQVHTCKNISDILKLDSGEFYSDFIVFILDSRIYNCLSEVEENLMLLDSGFSRAKICIVNPDCNFSSSVVSPHDIWEFAARHQLNLIPGKTKDPSGLFTISKRILNLAEACCGILNGIPMVNMV